MAAPNVQGWDQQIAKGLGVQPTPAVIKFLHLWSQAEGGSAENNPFNTTQPGFGEVGNYNSVGVKRYGTPEQGIAATIHTLQNGRYGNIIAAMKNGQSAVAMAQALAASPWGTGALVLKMLGQNTPVAPLPGASQAALPALTPVNPAHPLQAQPTMQQRFDAAGPSAAVVSLLGKLGGMAGRTAQAAQAPIPLPSVVGKAPLVAPVAAPASLGVGSQTAPLPSGVPAAQDVSKWVKMSASANRQGVPIRQDTLDFVSQVAQVYGKPLTVGTGTNHNQYVVGTHRESAHWTGGAADIPASGPELTRLGQDALIAAGADPAWARKQKGGLFNIGNHQVIFNSMIGGNHFNHLHVGMRG